ncbi:MAG TPA: GntR family transcriptional regulator [Ktedonobacterales bacterium]
MVRISQSQPKAPPPVISLDETSPTPKYQQIVDQVRALVAQGQLRPGDVLPSVRQLAADLTVNINTVLAAYRALEAEGIVLLRRGSRAVVHPRLVSSPEPGPRDFERVRSMLERVRIDALLLGLTPTMLAQLAADVFRGADGGTSINAGAEEGKAQS